MIRIGLIAEGEAELGMSIPYIKPEEGGKPIDRSREGALHTLIRRELQAAGIGDCVFVQRHPQIRDRQQRDLDRGVGLGRVSLRRGHGIVEKKYIAQRVIAWKSEEIDLVILIIDADNSEVQRRRDLARALETIRTYHLDANGDPIQDQSLTGLAIKSFDTWLLANDEVVALLLGIPVAAELPQNLEDLPGVSSEGATAKIILDDWIARSPYKLDEDRRDLRARWAIALVVDLETIKQRCQRGYVPFVGALCAAAENASR